MCSWHGRSSAAASQYYNGRYYPIYIILRDAHITIYEIVLFLSPRLFLSFIIVLCSNHFSSTTMTVPPPRGPPLRLQRGGTFAKHTPSSLLFFPSEQPTLLRPLLTTTAYDICNSTYVIIYYVGHGRFCRTPPRVLCSYDDDDDVLLLYIIIYILVTLNHAGGRPHTIL